jgi:hypothetical protein
MMGGKEPNDGCVAWIRDAGAVTPTLSWFR